MANNKSAESCPMGCWQGAAVLQEPKSHAQWSLGNVCKTPSLPESLLWHALLGCVVLNLHKKQVMLQICTFTVSLDSNLA